MTLSIDRAIAQAKSFAREGKIEKAEAIYRVILITHPDNLRAKKGLEALGPIGEERDAQQEFNKLVRLYEEKKIAEALAIGEELNKKYPNTAQISNFLGIVNAETQHLNRAESHFRETLKTSPKFAEGHNNLGNVLKETGRLNEAQQCFETALRIDPFYVDAHYNLGVTFAALNDTNKAIRAYKKALRINPKFMPAYNNLGSLLQALGRHTEALSLYERADQIKPNDPRIYNNIGGVLAHLGKAERGIKFCNKALKLKPDYSEAYVNLGFALEKTLRLCEAKKNYEKAIQLNPDNAEAHWCLSHTLLLQGNYIDGWKEYEWRLKRNKDTSSRSFSPPQWEGSSLEGKTILLHAEQGVGDTIQFIRYVPEVSKRGGSVIVECQKQLEPLLRNNLGIERVIPRGETLPHFDCHASLLSLPKIFGTEVSSIPAGRPYLSTSAQVPPLDILEGKKDIGIVWAGAAGHINDKNRSTPLSNFIPLVNNSNVNLFSLQVGKRRGDLSTSPKYEKITDLAPQISNYADTAAFIKQLDLIISVDTSVAHLAGAMGKSVWLLLPFVPDFRWMTNREDTPWYPTVRLFRQQQRGDWTGVFSAVFQALESDINK